MSIEDSDGAVLTPEVLELARQHIQQAREHSPEFEFWETTDRGLSRLFGLSPED